MENLDLDSNLDLDISPLRGLKALVLHSGGLDSTVALYKARKDFKPKEVGSISINYGQRHERELEQSKKICANAIPQILHAEVKIAAMPKSMLTSNQDIPDTHYENIKGISPTYVPFRNGLFLSYLATIAQSIEAEAIYIGAHAEDAKNDAYPDCSLHFIGTMGAAIYIGTYHQVRLHAPLIEMTKAEVVLLGYELGVPFDLTWSCYKGLPAHCGRCPTCYARKEAFKIAHKYDPTYYECEHYV